ncbi:DUF3800 domain-containing protein [Sphingobium mellinum]|uniref:DUF3800 domain-containing protein n=1 Tax=Sphingobium mellinum TaxID=1387166 RepID=UPI0030EDF033
MTCFRIDESGYTGFDLLNSEQRFQGATAIAIEDDDAAALIRHHFPRLQAPELKFSALSRRPSSHVPLLALLRDLLAGYKSVTYVCDKRFLLTLMFLEFAAEPFYYERDLNFYEHGQNFTLGSILYTGGPTLLGEGLFEKLIAAFQRAVKEKSPEALRELVDAARRTNWRELPEALGPIAEAAPECLAAIASPGVTTDAAMVVLQALISRMEAMSYGPYRVEHDQSKNLETYHDLIRKFVDHDEEVEFRSSEIATLKFPLKLSGVVQVDSKSSAAVQLADVLVGATLEVTNTLAGLRKGGLDPEHMIPLYAEDQIIHLFPSIDVAEQRRFRSGSQGAEMIDYFAANFGVKR